MSNTLPAKYGGGQVHNEHLSVLLARCAEGNESAFEELYALCSTQLYSVLARILRNEAIAEEALQDSFVKIWQKAGTYASGAGSPMAWMSTIARHQALDLLRRRGTRETHETADLLGHIESTADPAKPLHEMSEDARLLIKCLDKLPQNARSCIVNAYCEGYSHEELSVKNDAPISTIKSWIRRGLISLRSCLDELS